MQPLFGLPLPIRLIAVFVSGLAAGSLVNWAIYRLAWNPRDISPWGSAPHQAPQRRRTDRIPIVGWLGLRREHAIHGRGFWLRPLLLELCFGLGLAILYWWEVERQGLLAPQVTELLRQARLAPLAAVGRLASDGALHAVFLSHAILIVLMAAASFIDIDEKIIPDEITVPGTLLGLLVATLLPMALLPDVTLRTTPPLVGEQLQAPLPAQKLSMYVEPVTMTSPNEWPNGLRGAPNWRSLALGQACWWLWCFALAPRIWRGRRGVRRALSLIARRVTRELTRPPLGVIAWTGSVAISAVWWFGEASWLGLLSSLVGMAVSGGMVWIVRIVGTAALKREAMGFGDVTLMMMVGAFLGWQAGIIIFFVAPFAGLIVGVLQLLLRRDDVIPYGPFLCLGTLLVAVRWPIFWTPELQDIFSFGWLIAAVLLVCFSMLGILLAIWQQIKQRLFPSINKKDP